MQLFSNHSIFWMSWIAWRCKKKDQGKRNSNKWRPEIFQFQYLCYRWLWHIFMIKYKPINVRSIFRNSPNPSMKVSRGTEITVEHLPKLSTWCWRVYSAISSSHFWWANVLVGWILVAQNVDLNLIERYKKTASDARIGDCFFPLRKSRISSESLNLFRRSWSLPQCH